jgi:hypothetical protein
MVYVNELFNDKHPHLYFGERTSEYINFMLGFRNHGSSCSLHRSEERLREFSDFGHLGLNGDWVLSCHLNMRVTPEYSIRMEGTRFDPRSLMRNNK